jgi:hypothetical protein
METLRTTRSAGRQRRSLVYSGAAKTSGVAAFLVVAIAGTIGVASAASPRLTAASHSHAGFRPDALRHVRQQHLSLGAQDHEAVLGERDRTADPRVAPVRDVQEISHDPFSGQSGSEADTEAEPAVAVDPLDPRTVVAVFQQGRFQDGGAVAIGFASSADGGRTWVAGSLAGLSTATGGAFPRVSDPVVAFGPGHVAYAAAIAFEPFTEGCRSALLLARSDDGGRTFGPPKTISDEGCRAFDDKPWLAVDTSRDSPHNGRIYAAWTRVTRLGSPVVLRYSDDGGDTWSDRVRISSRRRPVLFDFSAVPLVGPGGDVTVAYISFDLSRSVEVVLARTLTVAGVWRAPVKIGRFRGFEAQDLRTGANIAATADANNDALYVVWQDSRFRPGTLNDIVLARSTDGGGTWSRTERVNPDPLRDGVDHFTPSLAATGGSVYVTYQTRAEGGTAHLVDQRYVSSADGGRMWSEELILGPPSDLDYAALVGPGMRFLGDYAGLAAGKNRVYAVWCRSAQPALEARYHQTTWAAALRP